MYLFKQMVTGNHNDLFLLFSDIGYGFITKFAHLFVKSKKWKNCFKFYVIM